MFTFEPNKQMTVSADTSLLCYLLKEVNRTEVLGNKTLCKYPDVGLSFGLHLFTQDNLLY